MILLEYLEIKTKTSRVIYILKETMNILEKVKKNHQETRILSFWIFLSIIATGVIWIAYLLVQQTIRLEINIPLIWLVQDISTDLKNNKNPFDIIKNYKTFEMWESLDTFIMIFNSTWEVIVSSLLRDGRPPLLPIWIFKYTKIRSEDRISWHPKQWIRFATVIRYNSWNNANYVLAGKSTYEYENLIIYLTKDAFIWRFITMLTIMTFCGLIYIFRKERTCP